MRIETESTESQALNLQQHDTLLPQNLLPRATVTVTVVRQHDRLGQ